MIQTDMKLEMNCKTVNSVLNTILHNRNDITTGASDSALLLTLCALQITILLLLLLQSVYNNNNNKGFIDMAARGWIVQSVDRTHNKRNRPTINKDTQNVYSQLVQ